jgi:hypothetical protein
MTSVLGLDGPLPTLADVVDDRGPGVRSRKASADYDAGQGGEPSPSAWLLTVTRRSSRSSSRHLDDPV